MLRKHHGLTLLELMVALALSLFLILVAAQFFVSSKTSYRTHQAEAELQDRGRYALSWLGQQLRQAGYVDLAHMGGNARSNFVESAPFAAGEIIWGEASALRLRYWGGSTPALLDCLGSPVTSGQLRTHSIDVADMYLRCDMTPVLPGVVQLVFRYGVDQDGDRIPERYLDGKQVDWGQLRAVRVCLLLQSIAEQVTPSPQTIRDCDDKAYQPDAKRIVRRFEGSVFLRNAGALS